MRPAFYVLLGVLLVPTVGLVGDIVTDGKFTSTLSSGVPLQVASDDMVANLNADMVDGVEGTDLYTKAEVDALVAAATDVCAPRQYYLSLSSHMTDEVLTACAEGYHFAAIYEIFDVSNLTYATSHPDARGYPDSGLGPPTGVLGWIRTGHGPGSNPSFPGFSNCYAWTSTSDADYGVSMYLSHDWESHGIGWAWSLAHCDEYRAVWCVED